MAERCEEFQAGAAQAFPKFRYIADLNLDGDKAGHSDVAPVSLGMDSMRWRFLRCRNMLVFALMSNYCRHSDKNWK